MNNTTLIGLIAATLTTLSFVPQVIKIWKLKETRDISLSMFVMLSIGILLWLVYGFLIWDFPVILANAAAFVLNMVIVLFKLKYK